MNQMTGLDNIKLPASVIADLFRDSLVTNAEKKPADAKEGYKFLGNNQKKITVLVNSPYSFYLTDHDLLFITKMLEACKLNIGDVAIVNHAHNAVQVARLAQQLHPRIILLFGVDPTAIQLPFTFPAFKLQEYNNCVYLCAPAPDKLNQDNEESKLLKSKLWVCLRKLFDV
ncbi:MAG TPA: hypothetical protein VMH01_17790 [Puia sp.]|nr:hypothetical protein [Puia sp.]